MLSSVSVPSQVEEIRAWIDSALQPQPLSPKMLVLLGPPGTGKSTAVQSLCEAGGIEVQTWSDQGAQGSLSTAPTRAWNSTPIEDWEDVGSTLQGMLELGERDAGSREQRTIPYTSVLEDFKRFVHASTVSAPLELSHASATQSGKQKRPQLLLLDEFPNMSKLSSRKGVQVRSNEWLLEWLMWTVSLQDVLLNYLQRQRVTAPVVLVLSSGDRPDEAANRASVSRLLGTEITSHTRVTMMPYVVVIPLTAGCSTSMLPLQNPFCACHEDESRLGAPIPCQWAPPLYTGTGCHHIILSRRPASCPSFHGVFAENRGTSPARAGPHQIQKTPKDH